jgi:DNA-binding IscR family transcriptional regulator
LVNLHDSRVGELGQRGPAGVLADVWRAVRTNVRFVLEGVTLADIVAGELPPEIRALVTAYRHDEVPEPAEATRDK